MMGAADRAALLRMLGGFAYTDGLFDFPLRAFLQMFCLLPLLFKAVPSLLPSLLLCTISHCGIHGPLPLISLWCWLLDSYSLAGCVRSFRRSFVSCSFCIWWKLVWWLAFRTIAFSGGTQTILTLFLRFVRHISLPSILLLNVGVWH